MTESSGPAICRKCNGCGQVADLVGSPPAYFVDLLPRATRELPAVQAIGRKDCPSCKGVGMVGLELVAKRKVKHAT